MQGHTTEDIRVHCSGEGSTPIVKTSYYPLRRIYALLWNFIISRRRRQLVCSGVARGGLRAPWAPGGTFWGAALCW